MVDTFRADSIAQHVRLTNHLQLTLRAALPKDAEQVLAYLEQVADESENLTAGPGEFGISLEQERVFLQQALDAPTSLYLLAEIAGEIVGTLTFSADKRPRVQHGGEFGMSVLRKYWNLGIGGRMLAFLLIGPGKHRSFVKSTCGCASIIFPLSTSTRSTGLCGRAAGHASFICMGSLSMCF